MFSCALTNELRKKAEVLSKKDIIFAQTFKRKILEITAKDETTVNEYKNLKSSLNEYKRINITGNYMLLFAVDQKKDHIVFIDIMHREKVYK